MQTGPTVRLYGKGLCEEKATLTLRVTSMERVTHGRAQAVAVGGFVQNGATTGAMYRSHKSLGTFLELEPVSGPGGVSHTSMC